MLPVHLIYVRHGESVRNLAGRHAFETGDQSVLGDLLTRPTSLAPLSLEGRRQAEVTGKWLNAQGYVFDRWYTSSYVRAVQTAGLLDLHNSEWRIENRIKERSSGVMDDMDFEERKAYLESIRSQIHRLDLFNFRPDRGESFADSELVWRDFLGTLHRECGDMGAVCVVNHGHNMLVARYIHEKWTTARFNQLMQGSPHGHMPNCGVLHYTRENPKTGEVLKHPGWMRITVPWKDPTPGEWMPIVRKRYSSSELLELADEMQLAA